MHVTLGDLDRRLSALDPSLVIPHGFGVYHADAGHGVTFDFLNGVTVAKMLTEVLELLSGEYVDSFGDTHTISPSASVWIAPYSYEGWPLTGEALTGILNAAHAAPPRCLAVRGFDRLEGSLVLYRDADTEIYIDQEGSVAVQSEALALDPATLSRFQCALGAARIAVSLDPDYSLGLARSAAQRQEFPLCPQHGYARCP